MRIKKKGNWSKFKRSRIDIDKNRRKQEYKMTEWKLINIENGKYRNWHEKSRMEIIIVNESRQIQIMKLSQIQYKHCQLREISKD